MTKKLLAFFLALIMMVVFSLPVLAEEVITGKIKTLDPVTKKINISGREYSLSGEAVQTQFKVGDQVEATIEGKVVKKLARVLQ